MVQEITASSNEQKSGSNQINSAILQLNAVTQQNAASAEELTSSAEELAKQAEQLNEITAYFNVGNKIEKKSAANNSNKINPSAKFSKTNQSKPLKIKSGDRKSVV